MIRYTFDGDINKLKTESYDVVIIGSGIAGLYTALNIDPSLSCLVVSKDKPQTSSSWYAQGGVAAVTLKIDNTELHVKDTLVAGAGLCDERAVRVLVEEGPTQIKHLLELGVPFDVTKEGKLSVTREGGHSVNRILHSGGDATGKELSQHLADIAHQRGNITIITNTFLTDILTGENGSVAGVIVFDGEYKLLLAPNVVIATGGIGQVFAYTTNPLGATGDGIAAALRAGAEVRDMEFVQFHPTALAQSDGSGQYFLISEAVRGEGGILRDCNGERFMEGQHPLAELAPRDIVARAIYKQMKKTNSPNVFLDITHKSAEFLSKRFPTIYDACLKRGLDISKQWIPVVPVQHYMMGGVHTDVNGMSNIDGLYACGETSCTGVHGANRLASNSLLECLVYGNRAAKHILEKKRTLTPYAFIPTQAGDAATPDLTETRQFIKNNTSAAGGIVRNAQGLADGIAAVQGVLEQLERGALTGEGVEVYNMALVSHCILQAAYRRKDSVGAHYRED